MWMLTLSTPQIASSSVGIIVSAAGVNADGWVRRLELRQSVSSISVTLKVQHSPKVAQAEIFLNAHHDDVK